MQQHNSEESIQDAIDRHDDPDHPDAWTVEGVRDVIESINEDILEHWNLYEDVVGEDGYEIVHEDSGVIVLADHTGQFWNEQFDVDTLDLDEDDHGILRQIVINVHHSLARNHTNYSWSVCNPVVVEKTSDFNAGETHILLEIARRTDQEGSVARAVDQYATDVRGYQKSTWASLTGRNRSSVTRTTND